MKQAAVKGRMDVIKKEARVEVIGEAHCSHRKMVLCIDTGEVFASVTDASKYFNCHTTAISNVCNGKRSFHTVKGKRFCFVGGGTNTDDHLEEIVKKIKNTSEVSSEIRIKAEKYDQMVGTMQKIQEKVVVFNEALKIAQQAQKEYENFMKHLEELQQEA